MNRRENWAWLNYRARLHQAVDSALDGAEHIRDINADMAGGCLEEIRSTLEQFSCEHGEHGGSATPAMFYREWLLCIIASERKKAVEEYKRQPVAQP